MYYLKIYLIYNISEALHCEYYLNQHQTVLAIQGRLEAFMNFSVYFAELEVIPCVLGYPSCILKDREIIFAM